MAGSDANRQFVSRVRRFASEGPTGSVDLNAVPEDCLLLVFDKYKSIANKHYLQRVDKRFIKWLIHIVNNQKTFVIDCKLGSNSGQQISSESAFNETIPYSPNLQVLEMPRSHTTANEPNNRIGDKELKVLAETSTDFRELRLCGAGNVSELGVDYICSQCPHLAKLSFDFCSQLFADRITGESLKKLTKEFNTLSLEVKDVNAPILNCLQYLSEGNGKQLRELIVSVSKTEFKEQKTIVELICHKLVELECLRYAVQWSVPNDGSKYGSFGRLKRLIHLEFESNSSTLDDKQLIRIMIGCSHLKTLRVEHKVTGDATAITDLSFSQIADLLPMLVELRFRVINGSINSVTKASISSFVRLDQLEVLSLKSFPNIGVLTQNELKLWPKLKQFIYENCGQNRPKGSLKPLPVIGIGLSDRH